MENKYKLGDDLITKDSLFDGVTFDDLILAVHCNCKDITTDAVRREWKRILDQRLTDTKFLIENNMEEIIARAKEGRET